MENKDGLALPKGNLMLIAVGLVIIIIGFLCMIGGGSEDGVSFNPDVYSSRIITVGPLISVLGFFFVIYAILRNPKKKDSQETGIVVKEDGKDLLVEKNPSDLEVRKNKELM